ncbi:MAG: hypothetical protein JST83_15645 [Bacteroidetes bacterium]|nr:hypothetical protein [Bacteroidota bacterium]
MNLHDDEEEDELRWDDEEGDEWKTHPLREAAAELKKLSRQILKTVTAIVETLPEEGDANDEHHASYHRGWMMENAMVIGAKLAGAGGGDYMILRENAVQIKLAARELLTQTSALDMFDYPHGEYLQALRAEIEEFRKTFVRWVRAFPQEDEIYPDGWGLFYTEEDVARWNSMNPDEPKEE